MNGPDNYEAFPVRRFWLAALFFSGLFALYGLWEGREYFQARYWENKIPRLVSELDTNSNGINDTDDIIAGARIQVKKGPVYKSVYYDKIGYPPDNESVCTDLIWRALRHAGYDLKSMMDTDIKANVRLYPRTKGKPDPNIDFRRVPNQRVFLARHGSVLTNILIPGDAENLAQWQPGDIVSFRDPDHIGILSTKRNSQGLPYLIHSTEPKPVERDDLWSRYKRGLTGHYRFPKN